MTSLSKRLARALVLVAVVGLVATAAPVRAAEFSFADPAGDATGIHTVASTPRPSDPELDILGVTFTSDATSLTAVIKLAALGTPVAATGASRTAGFTYEGAKYWFRFQAPQPPTEAAIRQGFIFRKGADEIPCRECSGKLDPKAATVRFTAKFASMTAGMKTMDKDIAPVGPGSKITALTAETYRTAAAAALAADVASPKGEVELVL